MSPSRNANLRETHLGLLGAIPSKEDLRPGSFLQDEETLDFVAQIPTAWRTRGHLNVP